MKKFNFTIATKIRQDYINDVRFSELMIIYNIGEKALCNIINNTRYIDPSYIRPPKKTTKIGQEDFIKKANLIHNYKYDYSNTKYITTHIIINIMCRDHGLFSQTPASHLNGSGCPICGNISIGNKLRFNNNDIDQFLLENNISIIRIGNYINTNIKLEFKCLICEYLWKTTTDHIKSGTGCPQCSNVLCDNNKIDIAIIKYNSGVKRLSNYHKSYDKMSWQCMSCNFIWETVASSIMRGGGCPNCCRGKNEKLVGAFLDANNIEYSKICVIINGKRFYPDYFLPAQNIFIEYNGIQHYEPTLFGQYSLLEAEEKLKKQKIRDNLLRQYCLDNKINLLEIDGRIFINKKLYAFLQNYFDNLFEGKKNVA